MSSPESAEVPGSPAFLSSIWRERPALVPQLLPASEQWTEQRFLSWCRPPVTGRVFIRTDDRAPGTARSVAFNSIEEAPEIWRLCRERGDTLTVLLNHVEAVDDEVRRVRDLLRIPYGYRQDDVVATLSTSDSGIGYHAGHEDGFIVQLRGGRAWRVWSPALLPMANQRAIVVRDTASAPGLRRPDTAPLIECRLRPGDALYIPPLHPHEGVTTDDSVSLAIGWRGISPYEVLIALMGDLSPEQAATVDAEPGAFFQVLPEALPDPDAVVAVLGEVFAMLGEHGPDPRAVDAFVRRLVS